MTKSTHDYIRDICHGYHERQREIEIGDKGRPKRALMLAEYMRLNSAVDAALLIIEDAPLRNQIRQSLIRGTGFEAVFAPICGRNQFYFYKRCAVAEIARLLHLCE